MSRSHQDAWTEGDRHEPYVGRWSRLVAREFLAWLPVPPNGTWLDVGCGTGALSEVILQIARPRSVAGVDPSEGYAAHAHRWIRDERLRFEVGDAQNLPFGTASFGVVVSGLVLNFVPRPERAVAEMKRVVRPNGMIAAYVWDYAGKMELMRYFWDAAAGMKPDAASLDEGHRFPLCRPETLQCLLSDAGLREVETRAIDVNTRFRDFDDYWSPFLGGQGPAPSFTMSLAEGERGELRERIRRSLPIERDGSIQLALPRFGFPGWNQGRARCAGDHGWSILPGEGCTPWCRRPT